MGTDPDGAVARRPRGGGHGVVVTGMAATGDVCGGHHRHEGALGLHPLGIGRLAEVGVEVDRARHGLIPP